MAMRGTSRMSLGHVCVLTVAAALVGRAALAPAVGRAAPARDHLRGTVMAGGTALPGARVTLVAANPRGARTVLAIARTDRRGRFALSYGARRGGRVLYLLTRGGVARAGRLPGTFTLAAVLGSTPVPRRVVVNEITTVGSAFSMAQFLRGRDIAGPAPGMPRAAAMVGHLADVRTGRLGFSVRVYATRRKTTPRTIRSLANMLAACTTDARACGRLLSLARPTGERRPGNTFEAVATIADDPWNSVGPLYRLSRSGPRPYRPALSSAPTAWTVAVRLMGPIATAPDGEVISSRLDGPGLVVFDKDGVAWISNNYGWGADPTQAVCAGKGVFALDPTVTGRAVLTRSLREYRADQLWGAGFGIAIDPRQRVWVGNFGFQGASLLQPDAGCTQPPQPPPDVSVSLFRQDGRAISPDVAGNPPSGGYTQGDIEGPQGMLSDDRGNVWIASCGNRSVVLYPGGDPSRAVHLAPSGLQEPFGLWLDGDRNAWVASNQTGQVYGFAPDGTQLPGSPFGEPGDLKRSMGITVDSAGNKWVANANWVSAPCKDFQGNAVGDFEPGSVTLLQTDGPQPKLTRYSASNLVNPWGIAVDGEDHVFVANFGGKRLAEICGVRVRTCPAGSATGDAIGAQGYPYDGLTRNTGVSIDPSGNVWLANNWLEVPFQTNPGGHAIVVYFGLAEPIRTPVFGPPVPVLGSDAP
jgi:hypothetical protein